MSPTFSFAHQWVLRAPADRVFVALADVEHYPMWWPQIRRVESIDEQSGRSWIRSLLPVTLELLLTREVEDPASGRLRVALDGDLTGWSSFDLTESNSGTVADYRQDVQVTKGHLGQFASVAAPVLRANHTWMMRSGERGLAAYLNG